MVVVHPERGKDIENRPRRTHYRGTILIHASQWWSKPVYQQWLDAIELRRQHSGEDTDVTLLGMIRDRRGLIVGSVDIVDCVETHESPWFENQGQFGWVLANPKPLRFPTQQVKGNLGLFNVD